MKYETTDLVFKKVTKEERRWNPSDGCYEWKTYVSYEVSTSDGLYHSTTDSDGFSYWNDGNIRLGSTSTDYFYITTNIPTQYYQQKVVDILNNAR